MDAQFWHQRWKENSIGFHKNAVNSMLVNYFKDLALAENSRVFVPLCGKTLDIAWLLSKGYRVAGVEFSELAIIKLFESLELEPDIKTVGDLKRYHASDVEIFVGDFFNLTAKTLGPIDGTFDRAALVALPEELRFQYAKHLSRITAYAPQLLVTYEYDQKLMDGPPFSVSNAAAEHYYQHCYEIISLAREQVKGGLKGINEVKENAWLLNNGIAKNPVK